MGSLIDLQRVHRALANLDCIAKAHPELKQGEGKWSNNLDVLESAIVGTPAKDRTAAYKARLRAKGYRQVTLFLSPDAHVQLRKLTTANPDLSVGEIVSDILINIRQ